MSTVNITFYELREIICSLNVLIFSLNLGSLALVSDAFHMLSDGIALVIALLSLIVSDSLTTYSSSLFIEFFFFPTSTQSANRAASSHTVGVDLKLLAG